jgi:hypothetical protein
MVAQQRLLERSSCFAILVGSTLGRKASQLSESAHQAIKRLTSSAMSLVDIVGKFIEMCESKARHSEGVQELMIGRNEAGMTFSLHEAVSVLFLGIFGIRWE